MMAAPEGYEIENNPLLQQTKLLEDQYRDLGAGKYVGMFVSGPPGLGKTFCARRNLAQPGVTVSFEKTIASNLTACLARNASRHHRIVFDDTDTMFTTPTLNLLKAAMDPSGYPRIIPDSRIKGKGSFEFCGGIVFISNINPREVILKDEVKVHFNALLSRIELRLDLSFDITHRYHYSCWLMSEKARGAIEALNMSLMAINEVFEWFSYFAASVQASPRSLMKFMKIRRESPDTWRQFVAQHVDGRTIHDTERRFPVWTFDSAKDYRARQAALIAKAELQTSI